jgi:AcrR family transcriptional regulator
VARLKYKPTNAPEVPRGGVRASTFKLLLDTAMELIQRDGHIPSVAEVAVRSKVSRATAYRYFPSRSLLVTAVIDSSLGPVRSFASEHPDSRTRLHELFTQTFPRFQEFEPQLRAAAQLSLEQAALERAGLLEEEPYRRGHRINILEHALRPLKTTMPTAMLERLHRALSVVYGIEPYIILKDIWGASDREVERIALWMADALMDAALRDAAVAVSLPVKGTKPKRSRASPSASPRITNNPERAKNLTAKKRA